MSLPTQTALPAPLASAIAGRRAPLIIGALLVVIVLLIWSQSRALGDVDAGLYGFWKVDADFADKAYIDAMYLYVEPPARDAARNIGPLGATCSLYWVIKTDGTIAFNDRVSTKIRRTSGLCGRHRYVMDFGQPITCIPRRCTAELDASANMLTLTADGTAYARLFKQPEASFYCMMAGTSADVVAAEPEAEAEADDDAE